MYTSPLHILSELDTELSELSDANFLLRLRKKLLAEFNLSNLPTIEINGRPYSKDEVIKTIDVLMGDTQMPLHIFIFANKTLLDFLENNASTVSPFQLSKLTFPEALRPMLGTLLLERVIVNFKKAFQARNFDAATDLLVNPIALSDAEKALLYEELNKNILSLQEHTRSISANGCENIKTALSYLRKDTLATFLNKLPEDFSHTIYGLASEIVNLMSRYHKIKKHDIAYLYQVSVVLGKIKCDERLSKIISDNHTVISAEYNKKISLYKDVNGESKISWKTIAFIIGIAIFVFRLFLLSNKSSNQDDSTSSLDQYAQNSFQENLIHPYTKEYESFKEYRKLLLSSKGHENFSGSIKGHLLKTDSLLSGNNPFRYILKRNSNNDHLFNNYNRVIINNVSGHDLIIITFNARFAKAYYFFHNKPDTLCFQKNERLCLYFGDTLFSIKPLSLAIGKEVDNDIVKISLEAYFKRKHEKTFAILEKDYTIELKNAAKLNNTSRSKKLPVLKFDEDFFNNDRYENASLKLSPIELEAQRIDTSTMPEVTITPK